ncbi:hypothetical protein [Endozoicomonas sp. 4G]|uniref:hypothetical protein n=1 Tax=Endozoicomonas sp. 4G TaxID=2872754 RepID=UPI002078BB56|nr:hypothetical protein [Endozoicomonas sp. 4G]
MSNLEQQLVSTLMKVLESVCDQVLLGYAATGIEQELKPPAILVQLESISELQQQGSRRKDQWLFNLSAVVPTNDQTTYALLEFSRTIRKALSSDKTLAEYYRKLTFSETQFDIAPSQGQLSFADITLTLETVF